MATTRTTSTLAGIAVAVAFLGAAWPAASDQLAPAAQAPQHESDEHEEDEEDEEEGYAAAKARHQEPDAIEAAFPLESYRPGATAALRIWTPTRGASVRVFHVGPERQLTIGDKLMEGVPVTSPRRFAELRAGQTIPIVVGDWPSGLYFAKVTSPGRLGFAPFVVAPKRLGEHPVAIVLPTRTWQAYNFRDDGGDGKGDTWYASKDHLQSRLGRPFLNRGVPPHYRNYDLRFLRWLHESGRKVDVLSQAELDGTTGAQLAQSYQLIVFPGHHEYVTKREYDAVENFRDRGGNLMLLSANNFFWRIDVRGRTMTRVAQWRDLGRPEASLLGVQYVGNDRGGHRGPWLVTPAAASGWVFAGITLRAGNAFSDAGVEIDAIAPSSPRGTHILAEIPNLLGPGLTAHMTYYETPAGAKVFAAGAFTLAGSVRQPAVVRLLSNLWKEMADDRT